MTLSSSTFGLHISAGFISCIPQTHQTSKYVSWNISKHPNPQIVKQMCWGFQKQAKSHGLSTILPMNPWFWN